MTWMVFCVFLLAIYSCVAVGWLVFCAFRHFDLMRRVERGECALCSLCRCAEADAPGGLCRRCVEEIMAGEGR